MNECEYVDGNPFYDQNWTTYDRIFIDFTVQYTQLQMGYFIKKGIFSHFPYNLPPYHLYPTLGIKIKTLRDEMIKRGLDTSESDAYLSEEDMKAMEEFELKDLTPDQQQIRALFDSFHALSRYGIKMKEHTFPEFDDIHISQNVISICSLVEGYIVSSLKYILENCTNGKFDRMKQSQLDDKVFQLTSKSFLLNLGSIEKFFSVNFKISKKQKNQLSDLFLVRNLYVHNNGIVTNHFLRKTSQFKKAIVNEKLILQEEVVDALLDNLTDVSHMIYESTSIAFLGKRNEQLLRAPQPLEIIRS
ncbi:hypothetical protein E5T98_21550 [Vibrio vulnificus]|nr:hypothetical protein [Vibrio vulnificus]EIJ0948434.1 hypothetical protein [Vibrio vulnificus]EJD0675975.1 hypothetical protein [Vibrio vulnificus]EJZ7972252.1 hypothetical protein [Vibrio vulnificus]